MLNISPGFEKYIPTRLEWLAYQLNTFAPYLDVDSGTKISKVYVPSGDGKTIILIIRYSKDIDKVDLEKFEDRAKRTVTEFAETYNWQS